MNRHAELTELLKKMNAVQAQQEKIFEKAKIAAINDETIKKTLETLCVEIASIMNCERVSIWLFNDERTRLHSQNAYDTETNRHTVEGDLLAEIIPAYFEAVQNRRTFSATDVHKSAVMDELRQKYFDAAKSGYSLLDASILMSTGISGVICCESRKRREWTLVDRTVISAVADMLSFLFDRLNQMQREENLRRLAYTDYLTGMNNYYAFLEQSSEAIARMKKEHKGIFIYLVIDRFTEIQSALGPEITEKIVMTVARRLQALKHEMYSVCRIAFDHFVLFAPYTGTHEQFKRRAEGLLAGLQAPILAGKQEIRLTFSYGIAYYPSDVTKTSEGVQAARFALETSRKRETKESVGYYDADLHRKLKQQVAAEMDLRKALEHDEFRLFYQPQVACSTGEVIGFEALIRWQHPKYGLVPPSDFIELAESTGFIIPIGQWVITQAVEKLKVLQEAGISDMTISINLSPRHFLQDDLPGFLETATAAAGVAPKNLQLEITESVALEKYGEVQERMRMLAEKGFAISIDDFGTGYSAFVYLQTFPITELKVDRTFIMDIEHNEKSRAITNSIIQLGKTLGIRTVAEGVETKAQQDILHGSACDVLQGYYFSKPLNEEAFENLMRHKDSQGRIFLPLGE